GAESYSGRFRALTWRGTANMAVKNPILGTGIGSFGTAYPRYAEAGFTEHAHNSYLQLAAEAGFPAAIFLIVIIGVALLAGIRAVWAGPPEPEQVEEIVVAPLESRKFKDKGRA